MRPRAGSRTGRPACFESPSGVPRSRDVPNDGRVRSSRMLRVRGRARAHDAPMLRADAIAFCDACEDATASFERGWRAYLTGGDDGRSVALLCPTCAEAVVGEDEA